MISSFPAAESFRQVLSRGPYEKIDRLLSIVGQDSPGLLESLIDDTILQSTGSLELPPFFRAPETIHSVYSFWKILSILKVKPLWFYNVESFEMTDSDIREPFRFPPMLKDCPELKTLILKGLDLCVIPEEVWAIRKLRVLDISGNRVCSVSPGIGRLRQLVYFNAADNDLETLPLQIGKLRKLRILNLSGNRIEALGFSLDSLSCLNRLNLSGNCLDSLPEGLKTLKQLERIQLSYNELSAEDEALWEEGDFSQISGYQWHFSF